MVSYRSCYQRRSPAKRRSSEIEEINEAPFSSTAAQPTVAQQIEVARVWAEDAGKVVCSTALLDNLAVPEAVADVLKPPCQA